MSGFTRSICPTCLAAYAPRTRACGSCGRKRDQKTAAEVAVERAAVHARTLQGYQRNRGVIKAVRILPTPGCCSVCMADDREFLLGAVPPLPHTGCTGARGCRCAYSPVTVSYEYERSRDIPDGRVSEHAVGELTSRAETVLPTLPTRVPHSPDSPEPPLLNWLRRMIGDS